MGAISVNRLSVFEILQNLSDLLAVFLGQATDYPAGLASRFNENLIPEQSGFMGKNFGIKIVEKLDLDFA